MEEMEVLKKAGLNDAQANVYFVLLSNGEMTPAEIAEKCDETRENCYSICKKLEELGLIEKTDAKKTTYRVLNPSNLELLAEKRRKIVQKNEKFLKDNISSLLDIFYANNELPGARTLEGIDGVEEVYLDILRTKKDVYLLRTRADDMIGSDDEMDSFLRRYRDQLPLLGIHTYALTPVTRNALKYVKSGRDRAINMERTWIDDRYDAPVAVQVYGDKVAFVAFGNKPLATIITSPLIAEAMRQILKILMDFYAKNEVL